MLLLVCMSAYRHNCHHTLSIWCPANVSKIKVTMKNTSLTQFFIVFLFIIGSVIRNCVQFVLIIQRFKIYIMCCFTSQSRFIITDRQGKKEKKTNASSILNTTLQWRQNRGGTAMVLKINIEVLTKANIIHTTSWQKKSQLKKS